MASYSPAVSAPVDPAANATTRQAGQHNSLASEPLRSSSTAKALLRHLHHERQNRSSAARAKPANKLDTHMTDIVMDLAVQPNVTHVSCWLARHQRRRGRFKPFHNANRGTRAQTSHFAYPADRFALRAKPFANHAGHVAHLCGSSACDRLTPALARRRRLANHINRFLIVFTQTNNQGRSPGRAGGSPLVISFPAS